MRRVSFQLHEQPPTLIRQMEGQGSIADTATTLNLRMRRSSIDAIEAVAKAHFLTMKQVIVHAPKAAGLEVADADLEDRTPR